MPHSLSLRRLFLGLLSFRRAVSTAAPFFLLFAFSSAWAQPPANTSADKITLDVSETFFSFFAGLNSCGYDRELSLSDAVRNQIRADVIRAVATSPDAQFERKQMCDFVHDHQAADPEHNVAQYVSLALYTSDPPQFKTTIREADIPPDAQEVLGYLPLIQKFYDTVHLHQLWTKYQPQYEAYVDRFHDQVAKMILSTDAYLRLPLSSLVTRRFSLYIEPLIAPGEVNARNYGADYLMAMAPDHGTLRMEPVRHTYLHYTLDPIALKRANRMQSLKPLLQTVSSAPLDERFKNDIALLVTESLIHAVEIRSTPVTEVGNEDRKEREKRIEALRGKEVDDAMAQGFVLTHYFYEQLAVFEKEEEGFEDAIGPMLTNLNLTLGREERRARDTTFSAQGVPDLVRVPVRPATDTLDAAEERLIAGDAKGAQEIAAGSISSGTGDQARAEFISARASSLQGHMQDAIDAFQKTLQLSTDPRTLAWSHIYLARIFDIREDRESALKHYNAALNVGDTAPDTKAAAERGIQQPYEPAKKK